MGAEWALNKHTSGIPGWSSFTGTKVGDTLLLPILATSLLTAFRHLPSSGPKTERLVLACGALIGLSGGLALQLSWLYDNKPRLSWILPQVHHFSPIGYYHAVFLCIVSSALFSLAFGTAYRARHAANEVYRSFVHKPAPSQLLFGILTCIWTFTVLTIQGGGAGISNIATISAVIIPSLLVVLLCVYALRSRWAMVLPTIFWAVSFTFLLCLLIIKWPDNIDAPIGLVVALGITSGISLRAPGWPNCLVESCIIGATAVCLVVLPLGDPKDFFRNLILALSTGPVIAVLTSIGPLVNKPFVTRCSSRDVAVICVFTASVPIAAWLLIRGFSGVAAGALALFLVSFVFTSFLVPWFSVEMKKLTNSEAAHPGVTPDPELSALARRVAFRGASWGIAALAALLGVVISAGPSMGFSLGTGMPGLNPWLSLAILLIALGSVTVACSARRSKLAPATVVAGSLIVFGLVVADLIGDAHLPPWLGWVVVTTALVTIWQIESIIGNAAMRPQWLVRRDWQQAVAVSVGLAVGALTLACCTGGIINSAGGPAESLLSLLAFIASALTGLMLIMGAGWSLDWQPRRVVDGPAPNSEKDEGEPNWARYRMRGCLLMDFGLIQGLIAIGISAPGIGSCSYRDILAKRSVQRDADGRYCCSGIHPDVYIYAAQQRNAC